MINIQTQALARLSMAFRLEKPAIARFFEENEKCFALSAGEAT